MDICISSCSSNSQLYGSSCAYVVYIRLKALFKYVDFFCHDLRVGFVYKLVLNSLRDLVRPQLGSSIIAIEGPRE